jgi:hypothetical protein
MPKHPTIAIRDCLAEIAFLHEIAGRCRPFGVTRLSAAQPRTRSRPSQASGELDELFKQAAKTQSAKHARWPEQSGRAMVTNQRPANRSYLSKAP